MVLLKKRFSFLSIVIVWITLFESKVLGSEDSFHPTQYLADYCQKLGYPFEVHYITTTDGYILQIHRFPAKTSKATSNKKSAPAIILMHGLLGSSADWIVTGPKRSFALYMHDNGYDVWLGNSRGNTFSKNHTSLLRTNPNFWNFSWHEIGLYDLSATIDFVRNTTKQEQIFYVGFSQGTTQFWVLMSLRPEYNKKIKYMMALAPVAFMGNIQGLIKLASTAGFFARDVFEETGYMEVFPSTVGLRKSFDTMCNLNLTSNSPRGVLCEVLITLLFGPSNDTDYKNLREFLMFAPAGASLKQLLHYATNVVKPGHFAWYDYGPEKNMKIYNSATPPEYPVHKITVPVGLYYSPNDWLAQPEDVVYLKRRLPNVVDKYVLKSKKISHLDFMVGEEMRTLLHERLLKQINNFK